MIVWNAFEVIGTIAFAISGALIGIEKKLDLFGIAMLAITTAIGGGIIRDTLIGNTPPLMLREPTFAVISILSALGTCLLHKWLKRFNNTILFFDAIGLGAFTATGASIAIQHDYNTMLMMIVLGVTTGVGGGVLRDVFAKEIPFVFRKEIYAVASIAGAVSHYYIQFIAPADVSLYVCFAITAGIRLLCVKYDIHLPKFDVMGRLVLRENHKQANS